MKANDKGINRMCHAKWSSEISYFEYSSKLKSSKQKNLATEQLGNLFVLNSPGHVQPKL